VTTPSTNAQDVVAVLAADFSQVFTEARAIKVTVNRSSKAMEHPLETGVTITDHRIILPVLADLSLVISSDDYKAVYQQISALFQRGELLTLQTRVGSTSNLLIEKMPHEESGDMLDGVTVALSLKEALFVAPQYSTLPAKKVARPKDADTTKRGQQQPTESTKKGSVLSGWFK
jgi:hypothetical protein